MKKVAICYYGLSSNIDNINGSNAYNLPVNYLSTYKQHKDILWKINNADIFIHTWGNKNKNDINEKYEPKYSIFEKQIDFTKEANSICIDNNVFGYFQSHHILSRWYSTKRVIKLKSKFEKKHNFIYDCVMVTRFDCSYNGNWDLSNLDMNYFYITGGWTGDYFKEFPDLWFFSNSQNMDIYGGLYDNFKNVFLENKYDNLPNQWGGHLIVRRHIARSGLINKIKLFKIHKVDSDIIRG